MPTATKFVKDQVKTIESTVPKLTKTGAAFTSEWLSANGHDLKKGDHFTTKDAKISGTIAGRFTKRDKDGGAMPHISCDDPKGFAGKCFRAAAADLLYVPPTPTARKPRAKKSVTAA